MKPKLLIKITEIFKQDNSPFGFTLVELLVATLMSAFVIAAAGQGLVTMLQLNKNEESKIQRQLELNRAMDYISEEVRMSKQIQEINAGNASTYSIFSSLTSLELASIHGISLTIPSSSSTVVYHVDTVTLPSIWIKDYVLKKDSNVLVDALVKPPDSEITLIKNACTAASATFVPNDINLGKGFYACIYPDTTDVLKPKRKIDLYLYGKTGSKSTDYVKVKTTAFARAK